VRRLSTALLVVVAILVLTPVARACTCGSGDPRTTLESADAAFIGELIAQPESRAGGSTGEVVDWRFRVHEAIKGELGDEVVVRSAISGTSCGLSASEGKTMGLFLERDGGEWRSGLCYQVDPVALRKAAAPLPPPSGEGPARFIVGTDHGDVRTLALDAKGRVVRYGFGDGVVVDLDLCPGSDVVAELVSGVDPERWWMATVARRELHSLNVRDEFSVEVSPRRPGRQYAVRAHDIKCLDPRGDQLVLSASSGASSHSRLFRIDGAKPTLLFDGSGVIAPLGTLDRSFVATGPQRNNLASIDLRSGQRSEMTKIIGKTNQILVNEAGTHVAGQAGRRTLFVAELRTGKTERGPWHGPLSWIDDERLMTVGHTTRVYDLSLKVVDTWKIAPPRDVVVDGVFYGANGGLLESSTGDGAPVELIAKLPTETTYGLVVLPDGATAVSSSRTPALIAAALALALLLAAFLLRRKTDSAD
jgi:hypothetical protein